MSDADPATVRVAGRAHESVYVELRHYVGRFVRTVPRDKWRRSYEGTLAAVAFPLDGLHSPVIVLNMPGRDSISHAVSFGRLAAVEILERA